MSDNAEKTFGFASMTLLSFEDLFAGKICATLDRQHPRDLYDTYWLLQHKGITQSLKNAFMVYLMGHNRPMAELLAPKSQDISPLYRTEFEGMAYEPVDLKRLQDTLSELVIQIHKALNDDRCFLLDLKQGNADWKKFPLPEAQILPAIQWKLLNLERMAPDKRRKAARKLEKVLTAILAPGTALSSGAADSILDSRSGVPQDWNTHMIGHEITALFGVDHGKTLAVVQPAVWKVRREQKKEKLLQYAERVWGITEGSSDEKIDTAIARTEEFFHSLGIPSHLSDYDVDENGIDRIIKSLEKHGMTALSEHGDVTPEISSRILMTAL